MTEEGKSMNATQPALNFNDDPSLLIRQADLCGAIESVKKAMNNLSDSIEYIDLGKPRTVAEFQAQTRLFPLYARYYLACAIAAVDYIDGFGALLLPATPTDEFAGLRSAITMAQIKAANFPGSIPADVSDNPKALANTVSQFNRWLDEFKDLYWDLDNAVARLTMPLHQSTLPTTPSAEGAKP